MSGLTPPVASSFLLGPRATGKSTWIQQHFGAALIYDLLDTSLALRLSREPGLLAREVEAAGLKAGSWVVLDEVQKVPALLDEVQCLMQKQKLRVRAGLAILALSARQIGDRSLACPLAWKLLRSRTCRTPSPSTCTRLLGGLAFSY